MNDDERCCGTGTCIINADGLCWCGQKWDGQKMCFPQEGDAGRSFETQPEGKAGERDRRSSGMSESAE